MARVPLPDLFVYSRPGCHLCEETRVLLSALLAERSAAGRAAPTVVERDITTHPAWERAFLETIPVLEFGERRLPLAVRAGDVRRFLAEALDGAATPR